MALLAWHSVEMFLRSIRGKKWSRKRGHLHQPLAVSAERLELRRVLAGQLDPSFSTDGKVVIAVGAGPA